MGSSVSSRIIAMCQALGEKTSMGNITKLEIYTQEICSRADIRHLNHVQELAQVVCNYS